MTIAAIAPHPASLVMPKAIAQPRAIGGLSLTAKAARGATHIAGLRQSGSLKALFPRGQGAALQAVFLNTAGGLTGGDRMRITAEAQADARIVLSSQAAERAYRAQQGETAQVSLDLNVAAGGRIDWLPQETILFEGAALQRRMRLSLATGARALVVEPLILGRAAMGEVVHDAMFHDRWDVRLDDTLIFADATRMQGDLSAHCARVGVASGHAAMAAVLYAGPDAAALVAGARSLLPDHAALSLVRDDLIFARLMAPDGYVLRQGLIPLIEYLAALPLPKVWRL